jgi:hypothetical protein
MNTTVTHTTTKAETQTTITVALNGKAIVENVHLETTFESKDGHLGVITDILLDYRKGDQIGLGFKNYIVVRRWDVFANQRFSRHYKVKPL